MKRLLARIALCALCVALLPWAPALADVIWEPEDDFFRSHMDECTWEQSRYYANGDEGFIQLYVQPGSRRTTCALPNGVVVYILVTYDEGDVSWGYVESAYYEDPTQGQDDLDWEYGWVPMEDLARLYDHQSFMEEHKVELVPYTGDPSTLLEEERLVLWTYPESGEVAALQNTDSLDSTLLEFSHIYTDAQGRAWGHLGYLYGIRDGWVCLDDPVNQQIPAAGDNKPLLIPPSITTSRIQGPGMTIAVIVLIALVALLIGVTLVLLFVLFGNKYRRARTPKDRT